MTLGCRPAPGPGTSQRRATGTGAPGDKAEHVDAHGSHGERGTQRTPETQGTPGEQTLPRLMAGVAHDFNNLLGAISNHLYLIEKGALSGDRDASIAAIRRSVDKGSQLTQHLQRFARPQSAARERLMLAHCLPALSEQLCALLGHGLTCRVCVEPGTPAVWVASGTLERALLRLALDAIAAVSTDRSPTAAPKLTLYARLAGAGECPALAERNPGLTDQACVKLTLAAPGETKFESWFLPAAAERVAAEEHDEAAGPPRPSG